MTGLIKISEAFSLGLQALSYLATDKDKRPITSAEMAGEFGVSETHLAKVMQRLAKSGFVVSKRGPRGGFVMKKDPKTITLKDIHAAADGLLPASKQTMNKDGKKSPVDPTLKAIYKFAYAELDKVALSKVMKKVGK